MAKNLVIVESPAKAKTIKKFLGSSFEVVASNGHVRDLPKSQLGIDIENDYEPKYITIRGKGDILALLRKEVKKADKVYLATDPDREGEAISWHLAQTLKLAPNAGNRISFNEITKNAVKNSIKEARNIDMDLVDSQQTRRILDRMVGYKISPLLWAKIKSGLSAGRVQSVALRIVCDREEEINAFEQQEFWSIDASFDVEGKKEPLVARLMSHNGKKLTIASEEEKDGILDNLKGTDFTITEIKYGEKQRKAPFPFTTSTLQQEAAKALNFSTQKTMRLAQQLYEGVDIKGNGTVGLITYLRTDSVRISAEAEESVRSFIMSRYGEKYVADEEKVKKEGKKIQDAHEAIRPTYVTYTPADVKESLSRDQFRLYQLIWKRFVASRMKHALFETVAVKIDGNGYRFSASSSHLSFEGFLSIYHFADEEEEEKSKAVSLLKDTDRLSLGSINADQHFTQPPAHYTEASLVKTMEELGIGRPSTYAPTITTLLSRHYVLKEEKNLYVTELGEAVNQIMRQSFPSIVDVNFTATLEELLDSIESGTVPWKNVVRNFYPDLDAAVKTAEKDLERIKIRDEITDVICEECGKNMVVKYGPHGKFLACPGFPECKNTKPYFEKTGIACPKCGGDILVKKTKKGRRFYGCSNHPDCDFMTWKKPTDTENETNKVSKDE